MIPEKERSNPLELIGIDIDPWAFFRGQIVEIRQTGSMAAGLYVGMTRHQKLLLQPHIEDRQLKQAMQERHKLNCTLHWNDSPMLLSNESVLSVMPRTREYFDKKVIEFQIPMESIEPDYDI